MKISDFKTLLTDARVNLMIPEHQLLYSEDENIPNGIKDVLVNLFLISKELEDIVSNLEALTKGIKTFLEGKFETLFDEDEDEDIPGIHDYLSWYINPTHSRNPDKLTRRLVNYINSYDDRIKRTRCATSSFLSRISGQPCIMPPNPHAEIKEIEIAYGLDKYLNNMKKVREIVENKENPEPILTFIKD